MEDSFAKVEAMEPLIAPLFESFIRGHFTLRLECQQALSLPLGLVPP